MPRSPSSSGMYGSEDARALTLTSGIGSSSEAWPRAAHRGAFERIVGRIDPATSRARASPCRRGRTRRSLAGEGLRARSAESAAPFVEAPIEHVAPLFVVRALYQVATDEIAGQRRALAVGDRAERNPGDEDVGRMLRVAEEERADPGSGLADRRAASFFTSSVRAASSSTERQTKFLRSVAAASSKRSSTKSASASASSARSLPDARDVLPSMRSPLSALLVDRAARAAVAPERHPRAPEGRAVVPRCPSRGPLIERERLLEALRLAATVGLATDRVDHVRAPPPEDAGRGNFAFAKLCASLGSGTLRR